MSRSEWGKVKTQPTKTPSFQASYIGPDGRRHYAPHTFASKMRATSWLESERTYKERCTLSGTRWISPVERAALDKVVGETLESYGKRWIAQRDIKPRTRIHYTSILETHIEPTLGKMVITNLTPANVRSWYAATLTDKPTLRAHAYGLLKSICSTAVKDGLLDRNPCQIDGATVAKSKTQAVILTVDELAQLAEKIEPRRFKALVLISAWCGLRYGEVTELRRKDIGENSEIISVGRAVVHRSGCKIDTPKSGKARVVMVPPHIRGAITDHLNSFVGAGTDALLFPPIRGGCHLSDKVIRDALAPSLTAVGREGVRIHDLRHFSGTQVARVGNLVETMNHLGHASVGASLRYQHMVSGRDAEIAAALSELATAADSVAATKSAS